MKTFPVILWMLSCVLAAAVSDAARGAETMTLKVMTFNIRYNNPADGENRWERRREFAAETIRRFAGDFVGLQEALPDQIADLHRLLPDYRSIGVSRNADPRGGEAEPIFYRHKRWRLDGDEQGTFWLSDAPEKPGSTTWGNGWPRIVTWARFIEDSTGRGVYVFNTHFDNASEPSRRKSAALLAERVAQRKHPDPAIVTGDFNADEPSTEIALLTGKSPQSPVKLVDTFRAIHPDAKDVATFHDFLGNRRGEKIDYVLVPPEAKVLAAEIVYDSRDGHYPSDHFPVTAEVEFPLRRD